ncbi:cation:proton antiporter [Mycobacterium sp. 141]|uniref:cation:proton antiporter domain-containing protein n=1 Tax=Mycobacterium sp. 141 TaxID=1120797 RepID=UPI000685BD53|nr:cation:proton antiporter [Mycobacterium sp. 141]
MTPQQTCMLLLGLATMVVLARLLGVLARRLGQPAVIGEMLAGIALGPTFFHGAVSGALFPAETRPLFSALAAIGVAVFMFIVGLEWNPAVIRGSGATPVTVSIASILLPFGLGVLLSLHLMPRYGTGDKLAFALFVGIAMSITAFPVLVRILTDRGMAGTPLGVVAVACAAIDDILAWSLLAIVVAITAQGDGASQWRVLLAIPYLLIMLYVVRPALRRLAARSTSPRLAPTVFVGILAGLLVSAAATEWIGLHYIFGAFLFGIAMPHAGTDQLRREVHERLAPLIKTLLLPVFFLVAGLAVDLSGLGLGGLGSLGLILAVAVGGKFVGAFVAACLNRMPVRQAAALGTLMNTRGLTELIVLNVGLQLGFIGRELYSLMVVMAVVTTAMAGPLLSWLLGRPDTGVDEPVAQSAGFGPSS